MQSTPRANKLQKSGVSSNQHFKSPPSSPPTNNNHIQFTNLTPQTPSEHYWASRALKAEALLSARERHYEEVGRVREAEECKRTREIEVLERRYKEKYSSLEKLVAVLISTILLLIALLIYLTTSHTRQSFSLLSAAGFNTGAFFHSSLFGRSDRKGGGSTSWLNLNFQLPSHFTIPILSPWTSVIEHQTSASTIFSTSSSFLKYTAVICLFIVIAISLVILINSYNSRDHSPSNSKFDQGTLRERSSVSLQSIFEALSNSRLLFSFAFWRWVWTLGSRTLRLIGFISR